MLYANAGDVTHRPLQDWDEATYGGLMANNLKGPFFLVQALLPLLANPWSATLCGSVSAHIGLPQSSAYAASKAGLLSLARTLSGELVGRGIRVNGLSPGPTETAALGKLGLPPAGGRSGLAPGDPGPGAPGPPGPAGGSGQGDGTSGIGRVGLRGGHGAAGGRGRGQPLSLRSGCRGGTRRHHHQLPVTTFATYRNTRML